MDFFQKCIDSQQRKIFMISPYKREIFISYKRHNQFIILHNPIELNKTYHRQRIMWDTCYAEFIAYLTENPSPTSQTCNGITKRV